MKVYMCCAPRTGSTLVENVLRASGINVVWRSHSFAVDEYVPHGATIVETIRNPLDIIASRLRVTGTDFTEETIRHMCDDTILIVERLYSYFKQHTGEIIKLRYEDFFEDFSPIFSVAERLRGAIIIPGRRAQIEKHCGAKRMKSISDTMSSFNMYHELSRMHGNHVSKVGSCNEWRNLIPKEHHALTRELMDPLFVLWGY